MPRRIQRQRTRGWRMPEGAVYVGRPSLWGNPWIIDDVRRVYPEIPIAERGAAAVRLYRRELTHWGLLSDWDYFATEATYARVSREIHASGAANMGEYAAIALRGRDLACWCPLCPAHRDGLPAGEACPDCAPCHASVLLEFANA